MHDSIKNQPPMKEQIHEYAGKVLLFLTGLFGAITISETEAAVRICAGIAATLAGLATATYYIVKLIKNKL